MQVTFFAKYDRHPYILSAIPKHVFFTTLLAQHPACKGLNALPDGRTFGGW
jgi:hypothetical protein